MNGAYQRFTGAPACPYCGKHKCEHVGATKQHMRELYAQRRVEDGSGTPPRSGGQVWVNEAQPMSHATDRTQLAQLVGFVCRWLSHPMAGRRPGSIAQLSCLCGDWMKPIVGEPDDEVTEVTVNELKRVIAELHRANSDMRARLYYIERLAKEFDTNIYQIAREVISE